MFVEKDYFKGNGGGVIEMYNIFNVLHCPGVVVVCVVLISHEF